MRPRILLVLALLALSTTACAGRFDLAPAPDVPRQLAAEKIDALYEHYKIDCEDRSCRRADGTYARTALYDHPFASMQDEIARNQHRDRKILWTGIGVTGALAVSGVVLLGVSSAQSHGGSSGAGSSFDNLNRLEKAQNLQSAGMALVVGAGLAAATTAIVTTLLPDVDDKTFEHKYNADLRADLQRRATQ